VRYSEAEKEAYVLGVFKALDGHVSVKEVMARFGLSACLFYDWVHERPEWELRLARARENQAHELVADALTVAKDKTLDPKERRVIVDTNLKVAALYFPQRYSQAALDRIVAPPEELEKITPAQIAEELIRAVQVAGRVALPAPADVEDAEFDDA